MNTLNITVTKEQLETIKSGLIKQAIYYADEAIKFSCSNDKLFYLKKRDEVIELFNLLNK